MLLGSPRGPARLPPPLPLAPLLQRRRAQDINRAQMEVEGRAGEGGDPNFALPPSLLRRYEVLLRPRAKAPRSKLREISADRIGALVTFKGIVTQVKGRQGRGGGWRSEQLVDCCQKRAVAGCRPPLARSRAARPPIALLTGVGRAPAADGGHLPGRPDRL